MKWITHNDVVLPQGLDDEATVDVLFEDGSTSTKVAKDVLWDSPLITGFRISIRDRCLKYVMTKFNQVSGHDLTTEDIDHIARLLEEVSH